MNIIKCIIRGQSLTVITPLMADLTYNYFNLEANFSREWTVGEWSFVSKWVHIHRQDDPTIGGDWILNEDFRVSSASGINLNAGVWEIWFSSSVRNDQDEQLWRLTTEVKTFEIKSTSS